MLSPWLLSTMIASTPAETNARTRFLSLSRVPTEAATTRLLLVSFVASGKSACFLRSALTTSDTSRLSLVMTGSLPFLESFRSLLASTRSTPSGAVVQRSVGVMMALTRVDPRSCTKSVSRPVTRPRSLEPTVPSSVTGKPLKPHFFCSVSSSASIMEGLMQTGSVMKPFLKRLTLITSCTWSSMDMFVWMTPMPPSSAMLMAILDSVTVSMGLETMGVFSLMPFEKRESRRTS
mmetsp:Transcript_108583/g.350526  ORF Transcript_108583/g.350526 Transcript_108583/m.350526 type:complete len:234 (+) Transcript_108583:107-808(+)